MSTHGDHERFVAYLKEPTARPSLTDMLVVKLRKNFPAGHRLHIQNYRGTDHYYATPDGFTFPFQFDGEEWVPGFQKGTPVTITRGNEQIGCIVEDFCDGVLTLVAPSWVGIGNVEIGRRTYRIFEVSFGLSDLHIIKLSPCP